MCDARCWNARSSPSSCRCNCRGRYHGRAYGRGARSSPFTVKVSRPPSQSELGFRGYLKKIGKTTLSSAFMSGFAAVLPPPFGAIAIPVYTAYNFSKMGYRLFEEIRKVRSSNGSIHSLLKVSAENAGESLSKPPANQLAHYAVERVKQTGLLANMAKATGIGEVVFSEMLKGSTASALVSSGGQLAQFMVEKAGGTN